MKKIYTQIGAGGSAGMPQVPIAREKILDSGISKYWAGDLLQVNAGYSTGEAKLFTRTAEEILGYAPRHPEAIDTEFMFSGQTVKTRGFRGIAQDVFSKHDPETIAGAYINYEAHDAPNEILRFDEASRPFTSAEFEMMGRFGAVIRDELVKATGKPLSIGWWNGPIDPLRDDIDWDSVRDLHYVVGTKFVLLNGYRQYGGSHDLADMERQNYEAIRDGALKLQQELPGVQIIVTLMPSTTGAELIPTSPFALKGKIQAIHELELDVLWWVNTDWTIDDSGMGNVVAHADMVSGLYQQFDRFPTRSKAGQPTRPETP